MHMGTHLCSCYLVLFAMFYKSLHTLTINCRWPTSQGKPAQLLRLAATPRPPAAEAKAVPGHRHLMRTSENSPDQTFASKDTEFPVSCALAAVQAAHRVLLPGQWSDLLFGATSHNRGPEQRRSGYLPRRGSVVSRRSCFTDEETEPEWDPNLPTGQPGDKSLPLFLTVLPPGRCRTRASVRSGV